MKAPARDFHTSTTVRVAIVRVVPVEPDLTVVRIPIAVRDVAVGETVLVPHSIHVTGDGKQQCAQCLPELSRGMPCIV